MDICEKIIAGCQFCKVKKIYDMLKNGIFCGVAIFSGI